MSGNDSQFQQPITGSITAISQSIDLSSPNSGTEIVQVTGTWTGTLIVEGSNDGVTYYPVTLLVRATKLIATNITSNGAYDANTNAFQFLRIRSSAWTSGTAVITVWGSDSPSLTLSENILRGGSDGTVIGNIGDALQVTNYSNGPVTPGTVANKSTLGGGQFNTVLPTLTTGQQSAIQLDSSGRLIIAPLTNTSIVSAAEDKNYGTVGTTTLRVASQIGNATGAANFNAGATGAQTLRTVANQGAPNTATNGWPTKITDGTDTAKVTTNSDLSVSDGLRNGGVYGALTLTTGGTTYEAKVGGSRLAIRKSLTITALDDMYWGYNSSVTTSTGTPLYKNQQIIFSIDPDSTFQVWLVASANSKTARITEAP